jgi:hypothetical protein
MQIIKINANESESKISSQIQNKINQFIEKLNKDNYLPIDLLWK